LDDEGPCPRIECLRYPHQRRRRSTGDTGAMDVSDAGRSLSLSLSLSPANCGLGDANPPLTNAVFGARCPDNHKSSIKLAPQDRRRQTYRRVDRWIRLFRERGLRMWCGVRHVFRTVRRHRELRAAHLRRKATSAIDARCTGGRVVLRPNNSRRPGHLALFNIIVLVLRCPAPANHAHGQRDQEQQ
jgi:hypothetical protein